MKVRCPFFLAASLSVIVGCSARTDGEAVGESNDAILNGVNATAYPEAATLNIDMTSSGGWACSASVIAPKVVLTAGHCIDTHTKWEVYVGTQYRLSTHATTYDWNEQGAAMVNPAHHDIGLIFLDTPITLTSYPTLAQSKVAGGSLVTNVGRIHNGVITSTLYQASTAVADGAAVGYPLDYAAVDVIEHGDSGGPDFAFGTHQIVAVNSGAGSGNEVLARVDLVAAWISGQIASHGGGGPPSGGSDAGASADAGAPDAALPSCGTGAETEPNDSYATASPFTAGAACGALGSPGDQDWFSYSAAKGSVGFTIAASGDAEMQIGQVVSGACAPSIGGVQTIALTASSAQKYCVRVSSPTGKTQTYKLSQR